MDNVRKYVIGKCPNCHKPIVYSNNPRDKITIKVYAVSDDYSGKMYLCAKCKRMYTVVEQPVKYVVLPII